MRRILLALLISVVVLAQSAAGAIARPSGGGGDEAQGAELAALIQPGRSDLRPARIGDGRGAGMGRLDGRWGPLPASAGLVGSPGRAGSVVGADVASPPASLVAAGVSARGPPGTGSSEIES